ncbi:MAG: hypothetical protein HQL28_05535 [Candidatus Omnitrophica bacterium]|nr:hypothetical protein [Candidatus Omnitrophota bacterium]
MKMTEIGMPVPPGVILSAEMMKSPKILKTPEFRAQVKNEIAEIRKHSKYPDLKLLLYARSGSAFTLPGLLSTIPNVGMNDDEAEELVKTSGDTWFAYDTYAEFLRSYAINIFGIPREYFDEVVNIYDKDKLTPDEMKEVCGKYKNVIADHGKGAVIPPDMIGQVMLAIDAVYASWDSKEAEAYRLRHRISPEWGSVVILQKGVFGNLNTTADGRISGSGAAALRALPDGRQALQGKFRYRSIGDQLMSRAEQNYILMSESEKKFEGEQTLETLEPGLYKELLIYAYRLKQVFGNNQHFEFTIELGKIWLTQTNDDIVRDEYPEFEDNDKLEPIGRGHGVSGGALRGWAANDIESARVLLAKYEAEKPAGIDGVVLFLDRVNPDMMGQIPQGVHIVAHTISVHAETLAQKDGISAVYGVVGMRRDEAQKCWYIGNTKIDSGMAISIDGHENGLLYHNSGKIFAGILPIAEKTTDESEGERRSQRALSTASRLRDQEMWEEAMRKRSSSLTAFEKEVLAVFEKYRIEKCDRREVVQYLQNYRRILDKIARVCSDIDKNSVGEELKGLVIGKLSMLGISFDLFIALEGHCFPLSDANRETIDSIVSRLSVKPRAPDDTEETEVFTPDGKKVIMRRIGKNVFDIPSGGKFVCNKPDRPIKLVSFEIDQVLEQWIETGKIDEIIALFKALKERGLDVVISTVNPSVRQIKDALYAGNPELKKYVDGWYFAEMCPNLERYANEKKYDPKEIMHVGSTISGFGDIRNSATSYLHRQGFVAILVENRIRYGTNLNEVFEKEVDGLSPSLTTHEALLELIDCWVKGRGFDPATGTDNPGSGPNSKLDQVPAQSETCPPAKAPRPLPRDFLGLTPSVTTPVPGAKPDLSPNALSVRDRAAVLEAELRKGNDVDEKELREVFYSLGRTVFTPEGLIVFNKVNEFYERLRTDDAFKRNILNESNKIAERLAGIGSIGAVMPAGQFYCDMYDPLPRRFLSLMRLIRGEVGEVTYIMRDLPDFDFLHVVKMPPGAVWKLSRGGTAKKNLKLAKKVYSDPAWKTVRKGIFADLNVSAISLIRKSGGSDAIIKAFVEKGRIDLCMRNPIPDILWNNLDRFICPEDYRFLSCIRDLIIGMDEPLNIKEGIRKDVAAEFQINYLLHEIRERGAQNVENLMKIAFDEVARTMPDRPRHDAAKGLVAFSRRHWEKTFRTAQDAGLISQSPDGRFALTANGARRLEQTLAERESILKDGLPSIKPGDGPASKPTLVPSIDLHTTSNESRVTSHGSQGELSDPLKSHLGAAARNFTNEMPETFGARLRRLVGASYGDLDYGASVAFAKELNEYERKIGLKVTDVETLRSWVRGDQHPDIKMMPVLANVLKVDPAVFVTGLPLDKAMVEKVACPDETVPVSPSFGRRVLILRWMTGTTPAVLAEKVKASEGSLTNLEKYLTTYPTPERITAIADYFGIDSSVILTGYKKSEALEHLKYPRDKILFLRLSMGLTQDAMWEKLVDEYHVKIASRETIAQWERGAAFPADPEMQEALSKMFGVKWKIISARSEFGYRLGEFIGVDIAERLKTNFEYAVREDAEDYELILPFPDIMKNIIMAYEEEYDLKTVLTALTELVLEQEGAERSRRAEKIIRSLDFYQKLFAVKSGTWRNVEEKTKYFASVILKEFIERMNDEGVILPAEKALKGEPYWCDILGKLVMHSENKNKITHKEIMNFISARKGDAPFIDKKTLLGISGMDEKCLREYGYYNVAYRLGYSVEEDLTDSIDFMHNTEKFKKRILNVYAAGKKFPLANDAGVKKTDIWAIALLKVLLGGDFKTFRRKFFEEHLDEIKQIINVSAPYEQVLMWRELLYVLPFDKDAQDFSVGDLEERAKDIDPVGVIIPLGELKWSVYRFSESGELRNVGSVDGPNAEGTAGPDRFVACSNFGDVSQVERSLLWAEIRRGNPKACEFVFNANIGLLLVICSEMCQRYGLPTKERAEFFGYGIKGLYIALSRFDPSRKVKFSVFAAPWIRQTIARYRYSEGAIIRLNAPSVSKYYKLKRELEMLEDKTEKEKAKESYKIKLARMMRQLEDVAQKVEPFFSVAELDGFIDGDAEKDGQGDRQAP